ELGEPRSDLFNQLVDHRANFRCGPESRR
ncbi:MAG: hypothetical protein JWM24_1956, partial [Solirubrobacterales bacterium]|nr:hypothetical protein [Solirubrobacterales bacterium]